MLVPSQPRFEVARVDGGSGAALAQAMRDEIAIMYDGLELDGDQMPKAGPAELSPPGGLFVVGYLGGDPVCCGGLKRLDDRTCEIKKMFVARLDTGPKQVSARALFESEGFSEIDDFNGNPVAAFWGEKPLG